MDIKISLGIFYDCIFYRGEEKRDNRSGYDYDKGYDQGYDNDRRNYNDHDSRHHRFLSMFKK